MAAQKKKTTKDPFASLRPKETEIPVGDHILVLKTATLDQEGRLLTVLSTLDLGELVQPIGEIMSGMEGKEDGGMAPMISQIAKAGPALWEAARKVLGAQFVPTVREAAVVLLDTNRNRKILADAELIPEDATPERGEYNEYIGCDAVRSYIINEITLVQASLTVRNAFEVNGYMEALGNLIPLTLPTEIQGEMQI